jgi:hypothetical protein
MYKHSKHKRNKAWRTHKQNSIVKRKLKERFTGSSYWFSEFSWKDGLYTHKEWDIRKRRGKYNYKSKYTPWEFEYYRPHYKKRKIEDFNESQLYLQYHY